MTARYTRIRNTLAALLASCLAASAGAAEQVQVTGVAWAADDCGPGPFKMGARGRKYWTESGVIRYEMHQRCVRARFGGRDVIVKTKERLNYARDDLCPVNQFILGVHVREYDPYMECAEMYDSENRRLFITPQGHWRDSAKADGELVYELQCPDNQVMIAFGYYKNVFEKSRIGCGTVQYQK